MDLLRRAARGSSLVRQALIFVAFAVIADVFAAFLTSRAMVFFTFWALAYLTVMLVGFARGAKWASDPDIRTLGRAPDPRPNPSEAHVASRTVRLPLETSLSAVLMEDARRRSHEGRAWVMVGSCFVFGGALFIAVLAGDMLLFGAALLITFVPAALIWVLAGPPHSAEAEWGEMDRTEGPVRLSWTATRGGRSWTVRVGNRTLHVWDDVGLQLANMPWGVVDYTASGRILRVRDIDGNTVFELQAPPEAAVIRYAPRLGLLFIAGWLILGLVVRVVR
jgi:hypothetical protein